MARVVRELWSPNIDLIFINNRRYAANAPVVDLVVKKQWTAHVSIAAGTVTPQSHIRTFSLFLVMFPCIILLCS